MYAFKHVDAKKEKKLMRLAIFTHVIHKKYKGEYYAYSPYVREINLWIKNAEEVQVFAPLVEDVPDRNMKYIHQNLKFRRIPALDLLSLGSILRAGLMFPIIFLKVLSGMHRTDHIHIRCPGNIGLIACIAQMFFPQKKKSVKYAGNWDPDSDQPWSYNLQKWILNNKFLSRNMNVLVYGNWRSGSNNIQPFYTASFSEKKKTEFKKDFSRPYNFIFAGNLVKGKGVFKSIDLIENIRKLGYPCTLNIYGDGKLHEQLKNYIIQKNLTDSVFMMGRTDLMELEKAYRKAHFVILLSKSEGWPKVLAEGMWYGAIPVSTAVSCIPWMLGNGERGILINDDKETITNGLEQIKYLLKDSELLENMSQNSMHWAQEFTLERFERDIKEFL